MPLQEVLDMVLLTYEGFQLSLFNVVVFLFVILMIKVIHLIISNYLKKILLSRDVDPGRSFSIVQFAKYALYFFGTLVAISSLGINLSILWAGSAALLVGIGFGLQQTFNDFLSGIILLLEGSVEIGDVVFVDNIVGKIVVIGLRTSKLEDRNGNVLIIPNSKLITGNVNNWSNNEKPSRFSVDVGVGYGTDVQRVEEILTLIVKSHKMVLHHLGVSVQFKDFGSSSLDFRVHFYSDELMKIEKVKSDLRFEILAAFRAANIEIPFPQQDVWVKQVPQAKNAPE